MRARSLLAGLILLAASLTAPAGSQATYLTRAQYHSLLAIHDAAVRWGVSEAWLDAVAWCESGMDPDAVGDGGAADGIFQFHGETFARYADALDLWKGRQNSWAAANVAAHMFAQGLSYNWTCAHA